MVWNTYTPVPIRDTECLGDYAPEINDEALLSSIWPATYTEAMRDFSGFLYSVLLPAFAGSLFVFYFASGVQKGWQQSDRSRTVNTGKERVTSIAIAILIPLALGAACARLSLHHDLRALHSYDVQEIDVGERRFTDQASIGRIVNSLNSCEWYSVNHGGWGDETPIVVKMNSGEKWQMRAGYDFFHRGAVVLRSSGPNGRGWALGEVFSLALPETLEQLGVPLSRCDTRRGHPCQTGTSKPMR